MYNYKYLINDKIVVSKNGVEWIYKNVFKQRYLELLEKYIKAGYPYDHF